MLKTPPAGGPGTESGLRVGYPPGGKQAGLKKQKLTPTGLAPGAVKKMGGVSA